VRRPINVYADENFDDCVPLLVCAFRQLDFTSSIDINEETFMLILDRNSNCRLITALRKLNFRCPSQEFWASPLTNWPIAG